MAQALNHLWSRIPHPRPSTTVVFFSRTLNNCLSRQTPPIQSHTNPISKPLYFSISSPGSRSFCSVTSLVSQSLTFLASYTCGHSFALPSSSIGLPRPYGQCRFFSASFSDKNKNKDFGEVAVVGSDEPQFKLNTVGQFGSNVSLMNISEIIEVIRSDEDDLEFKLNETCLNLSVESLSGIFRVLNCEKLSALRFFIWAQDKNPSSRGNPHICSLIIDNCGWLDDYDTMLSLLKDFRKKGICLNEKAFGFLPVLGSNRASIMESIRRVVELLNEVGGSCRGSGICVLVKMLCKVDLYEMAKFVIEITGRRASYYNIIILERCRKCCFGEARDMLEEMRQASCDPDAKTYNYLLSALCKHDRAAEACSLLEEMKEKGCPPNSLTFEIFICYSCRLGKLDSAVKFFDHMVSLGLEPRLTTHAAFIKSFFHSRQYEEAYKYVVNSGDKYKPSGNMIYSLLASLHQRNGDLITAGDILINMMDKGLIPSFPVYMRILKRLHKSGRGQLASYVKSRFSRLRSGSSNVT